MGARDKSIMHKVSFLAKWLSSIKTWPSSSSISRIHSIVRDSCKKSLLNISCSLTINDHTFTGVWLMSTFTIKLSNWLTFPVMILIPCSFSSNHCTLIQNIWFKNSNSLKSRNWSLQTNQQTLNFKTKHQIFYIIENQREFMFTYLYRHVGNIFSSVVGKQ